MTKKDNKPFSTPLQLPKGSVARLVVERIEEALISRDLKPGDYLPSENEFVRSLGVGKTSVREAIKMLEALGIVDVRQGSRTVIRDQIDDGAINTMIFQLILEHGTNDDLLELRMIFEPATSVLAMKRATHEDVERITKTVTNLERRVLANRQTEMDDIDFHLAILETTRNPFIIRVGKTILQLCRPSVRLSMLNRPSLAVRMHKKILEAFCERNETKLVSAIYESAEGWKESLAEEAGAPSRATSNGRRNNSKTDR